MSTLSLGTFHHIRFTVTDVARSRDFYAGVLGFQVIADGPPPEDDPHHRAMAENLQGGIVMTNGSMILGLMPVSGGRAADAFDPYRVGLDHIAFTLPTRDDLLKAAAALDESGVPHGPVKDLPPFNLSFLAFFDPDGIALEFTAPMS